MDKIDLAELKRFDPYADVKLPTLTKEDHQVLHDFAPGYKFAYLYKHEKKGSLKPNGYSEYVREQVTALGRTVQPADYDHYGKFWEALPADTKNWYKDLAEDRLTDNTAGDCGESNVAEKERARLEARRDEYGIYGMSEEEVVNLYFPPAPSEHPQLRGREHPDDLATVQALYALLESEQRDHEEAMVDCIERCFTEENFSHQRIFFLDCIAVSNDPDPLKCVHSPLEFYLTSFSIKDGLSDMGYHSFVLAGNELSVPSEHKHGTTLDKTSRSFREFARASAKASKAAWHQAHFRHNIPYEGFIALDERYQSGCAELDRHYNGWDVHATRTIKLSDSYLEMYGTIVDILTERSDGSEAPIVFTKFQDVDMVKECLTWLRNNAMEEAEDYGMLKDKTEIVPIVCSMEHLIWHFGRLLNFPFTEEKIEIGFNSARFHNLYRLRCAYHDQRPENIECARSTVLCSVYNCFELLLGPCGLQKTANHYPAGKEISLESAIEDEDENVEYDDDSESSLSSD